MIELFNKYLLSTYYFPDASQDVVDKRVNETMLLPSYSLNLREPWVK